MDPIAPIRRSHPAAVERVGRIARAGEDRPADERRRPPRESEAEGEAETVATDPAAPAVDGHGHIDARA